MAPDAPSLRPGERLLDRYRIDALHEGGMGLLCVVTDAHTGRRLAAKTVKPAHLHDPAVRARFRDEARTWIDLGRHENVVQALWFVEAEGAPLLFLEYVDGPELAAVLARGPLPLPRALDLAMQCAAGMAYAHTRPLADGVGIVHRDLNPRNLLLTSDDTLKISDFGLARVFRGRGRDTTEEGVARGTLAYMAPEQLHGSKSVDGRADVYAFGLVLYEMLAGKNPLRADDVQEQIRRVLNVEPPPLEEAPPALAALVARCVAKEPERRPRDFGEVLAHLAQLARGLAHPWHVDPRSVGPAALPVGVTVAPPALRPRRPRTGDTFSLEIEVGGDLGPGPVEVSWHLPAVRGLKVLTPGRTARARVEAGGSARVALRLHAAARKAGRYALPASAAIVRGPGGRAEHPVPPFEFEVAFSFVLPVVGRDAELARIAETLRDAAAGRGALLLVRGESGGGKSRLLQEAARLATEAGARVAQGRAEANDLRPMRILHEVARDLLHVPEGDPRARPVARRVAAALEELLPGDHETAAYFRDALLGEERREDDSPPAHRWYALFAASARRGPLALLFDDLDQADPAASRILFECAPRLLGDGLPVTIVATASASPREGAPSADALAASLEALRRAGSVARELELRPLTQEEVNLAVDAVFPRHGFAEEVPWLLRAIRHQSGGNPFHLVEILRALRMGPGALVRKARHEWRLSPELTPERIAGLIPNALEAAVRQRLEALPAAARDVLEVAALAGEEFDVALLRAATGGDGDVDRALEVLEEAEIVVPVDAELDRYRFWRSVVPAVVERALVARSPKRARRLHLAIAEGILAVYKGDAAARRALSVARHLRAAGAEARSLAYTLEGCDRLLSLELPEHARQLLAEAAPLAEDRAVSPQERARFLFLYGVACEASGDYTTGLAALTRFVETAGDAPAAATPRNLARAYTRLGRIHQARAEHDRAAYCFGVARTLLEEVGDRRSLAFCHNALAALALERGEILAATRSLETAGALARETRNDAAAIQQAVLRGKLALRLGDVAAARRAFADAEERARSLADRRRLAAAVDGLGLVALASGYLARAQRHVEEALELHAQIGDRQGLARSLLHLGAVYRARGRGDRALREFRRAQRVFDEIGHPEGVAEARRQIGRLLRARLKTAAAVRELAAASEAMAGTESPDRYACLRDLGEALADSGAVYPARLALARADRGEPFGSARRQGRVLSRATRASLWLASGDARRARVWAERAVRHAARTTGHAARIAANLALAEVAIRAGELHVARRSAETALAFAREQEGDPFAEAAAERVLAELAARAGRRDEARERAHRAARAYTGRADAGDGPARLLLALGRGLSRAEPKRSARFLEAARRCFARMEAHGHRREAST